MNKLHELAKDTISLPSTGLEAVQKAAGIIDFFMFSKVAMDQSSNELLHSTTERAIATGSASALALGGLAMVIGARRMHQAIQPRQELA